MPRRGKKNPAPSPSPTRRWWTASSGSCPYWGRRNPWPQDTRFAPRPVQHILQTLQSALPHVCIRLQNIAGRRLEEIDIDDLPMEDNAEEDDFDLDEYSFSKFASMYFQGAATPTFVRQRLRQPLLHHEDKEDVLVIVLCRLNSPARLFLSEDCPCLRVTVLLSSSAGLADRVVDHPQVHGRSP